MLPQAVHSFQFDHLPVRVLTDEHGEPWFVAKDVASMLGYSDTAKAARMHCKAARPVGVDKLSTLDPQTVIIPERDLYRLVMRSKLPAAEKFEEWVVAEVLPSIRKTGTFNPNGMSRMELLQIAMQAESERLQLQQRVEHLEPQAKAYERVSDSAASKTITEAAKDLQIKPSALMAWLRENRWIYSTGAKKKRNLAYQPRIDAGLMEHKVTLVEAQGEDGTPYEKAVSQPRITMKGLMKIAKAIGSAL